MSENDDDEPPPDAMDDMLVWAMEFIEGARQARDDVQLEAYLKAASRFMRNALEIYGRRLEAEIKQGEV